MPIRLIITIIMLAAALVTGFIFDWPKYQSLQLVQSEFKQKEAELSSKRAYYGKINEVWGRLKEYEDVLSEVDAAIPQNYSVPILFNYLWQTAGQTGLVPKSLIFGGANDQEVKEISISFQVSGSYSSLKSFLAALEGSARFFKVKDINFSSAENKGAFSFNLEITAYSY